MFDNVLQKVTQSSSGHILQVFAICMTDNSIGTYHTFPQYLCHRILPNQKTSLVDHRFEAVRLLCAIDNILLIVWIRQVLESPIYNIGSKVEAFMEHANQHFDARIQSTIELVTSR